MPTPPILPENILRCLDPAERRALGKGALTAAEAIGKFVKRTEREIHSQFTNFLRLNRIGLIHSNPTKRSSIQVGLPDFAVFKGTKIMWVEFKVPPNNLTAAQTQTIEEMIADKCHVIIAVDDPQGSAYTKATTEVLKFFDQ